VVLERGRGSHVWDLDGNEYVDFMMSFGALIQGHAHPKIVEVVSQAIAEGSHFAAATSAELDAAERFRRMVPTRKRFALPTAAVKRPCWRCGWREPTPGEPSSSSSKATTTAGTTHIA
jgi:glutamate-1-semialdehyde aminotransferase